jgi:hypothetical protein
MILKTFLKPKCGEAISSFMCKNILFHCIAESENNSTWNERSLLTWLSKCLQSLLNCILTDHCPHFMIPRNNLLAGKLSADVKRQLVDVMCSLTENIGQSLLSIQIDDLGNRLYVKSGGISHVHLQTSYNISVTVASSNTSAVATCLMLSSKEVINLLSRTSASAYQILIDSVLRLCQVYRVGNTLERVAVCLYAPFLCSQIGSVIASEDIQHALGLSAKALVWFTLGLNSDISSGKLKQASALYCARDLERCEIILTELRRQLSQTVVVTLCFCIAFRKTVSEDFKIACYEKNVEDVIKHNMTFCVIYLPCEINCVPKELKYEMFRSTAEDQPYRDKLDYWMDWAVVDSMPYLYFLQYKVYTQLHRPAEQRQALDNLIWTIDTDPNLGHRETALNLLGQCMEQENRMDAALYFYMMSLKVRGRNNAAKWHICRLLAGMYLSRSE